MNTSSKVVLALVLFASSCVLAGRSRERFADPDLDAEVEFDKPIIVRTEENLLKVSVPLRNVSGEELQLLVQIQFLNELGAPYNDETNRRSFLLPRGAVKWFSATSMQSIASDYVFYVWRAE